MNHIESLVPAITTEYDMRPEMIQYTHFEPFFDHKNVFFVVRPNKIDEEIIGQFSNPPCRMRGLNFIYYENGS